MTDIHFFGCSYTAGDELSDEIFFPWKKDCKTHDEYFSKRFTIFNSDNSIFPKYNTFNKKLAYPNKIKIPGINTYNHAMCGSSLQEQVLNVVELVNKNSGNLIIYFQIPPGPRKLKLVKGGVNFSVQINDSIKANSHLITNYVKSSLNFIDIEQFSIEDILELLFLKNYLSNKNIPCFFIELKNEYKFRKNDILNNDRYKFLIGELESNIELISLEKNLENHTLLGGHYSQSGHQIIADSITDHIMRNIKLWNI